MTIKKFLGVQPKLKADRKSHQKLITRLAVNWLGTPTDGGAQVCLTDGEERSIDTDYEPTFAQYLLYSRHFRMCFILFNSPQLLSYYRQRNQDSESLESLHRVIEQNKGRSQASNAGNLTQHLCIFKNYTPQTALYMPSLDYTKETNSFTLYIKKNTEHILSSMIWQYTLE